MLGDYVDGTSAESSAFDGSADKADPASILAVEDGSRDAAFCEATPFGSSTTGNEGGANVASTGRFSFSSSYARSK
jgi:hypothetical protein